MCCKVWSFAGGIYFWWDCPGSLAEIRNYPMSVELILFLMNVSIDDSMLLCLQVYLLCSSMYRHELSAWIKYSALPHNVHVLECLSVWTWVFLMGGWRWLLSRIYVTLQNMRVFSLHHKALEVVFPLDQEGLVDKFHCMFFQAFYASCEGASFCNWDITHSADTMVDTWFSLYCSGHCSLYCSGHCSF